MPQANQKACPTKGVYPAGPARVISAAALHRQFALTAQRDLQRVKPAALQILRMNPSR